MQRRRALRTGRTVLATGLAALLASACGGAERRPESLGPAFVLNSERHGAARELAAVAGDEPIAEVRLIEASGAEPAIGSRWRFTAFGQGVYRITNEESGPDLSLSVDRRDTAGAVGLVPSNKASSQLWSVAPLVNGHCRLSSMLFGPDRVLDIGDDGVEREPRLAASGNHGGQHWRLVPAEDVPIEGLLSLCSGEPHAS